MMNSTSVTPSSSFNLSVFKAQPLPLSERISIQPPYLGFDAVSLAELDPFTLSSFKELITEQFARKLDYFIAIDKDEHEVSRLHDGFYFLKNYWKFSNSKDPLSKGEIKDFALYRLNAFDSTQTFQYFCSKKDIDENRGYLKHIEAHFPEYKEELRGNAFCDIAQEYGNGKSVFGKNEQAAYAWYKRAALTFDHSKAFTCLSALKYRGMGTKQSNEKSFKYMEAAAEKTTDGRVCYIFADYLETGIGTQADPARAYQWYQKALDLGCEAARPKVESLSQRFKSDTTSAK